MGAVTRWRPILYLVGWALIIGAFVAGIRIYFAHPRPDRMARFPAEFLLFHAGLAAIVVAVGLSLFMLIKHGRYRFFLGPVLNAPLLALTWLSGQLLVPNFQNAVCGQRVGCFDFTIAPIPTDTIYEIWKAPSASSFMWTRFETGLEMNYSEDGSYLNDPHLLLSGNEKILVLARGGYFVDAFETTSGRVLSRYVAWSDPNRDAEMQANSDDIGRLLETNR